MLTYFPRALPDEILYSRLARYHRHCGSTSAKQTIEDLFGSRSVRASVDLQCRLRALSERMPACARQAPETLVRATLHGYYVAYQPPESVERALRAQIDGPGSGLHALLGIAAGRALPPHRLRWCPCCREAAIGQFGEDYWHRSHQLPGVLVCPEHGVWLKDARLPAMTGQHDFIAATEETCLDSMSGGSDGRPIPEELHWLARRSAKLLDASPAVRSRGDIQELCRQSLIAADLALPSGRLRLAELRSRAELRLSSLHPHIAEAVDAGWVTDLGRRHRHSFTALQHLLFELVTATNGSQCEPRRRPVKRTFLADDVDFEARLRRAARRRVSLRGTARELSVDPRTVLRHAARLGLEGPWHIPPFSSRADREDTGREHRARCEVALLDGCTRSELRHQFPADFVWLWRHDRSWLAEHSPPSSRRRPRPSRLDWTSIDGALCREICRIAKDIRRNVPPVRVTLAEIERRMGRSGWFCPRRGKLPICEATLLELCETVDSFRLRRIAWARRDLLAKGLPAASWRIHRLAGLPSRIPITGQGSSKVVGNFE